ncbi:MAG: hypothetical protein GTN49_03380 [candidate division Zixibacteria bacterium]|nr:hypothetical protein [candidate division Zixibacteria bacterium]
MEKVYTVVFALAMAAAAWATPPKTYLEEDFSGMEFPPPGWTIRGGGTGTWGWINDSGSARGDAGANRLESAWTKLYSRPFNVPAMSQVRVKFRYRTRVSGSPAGLMFYIHVGRWSSYLEETLGKWYEFDKILPVFIEGGDVMAGWEIYVGGGIFGGGGYLWVDDIRITEYNVGVDPTSLGRVKALYR